MIFSKEIKWSQLMFLLIITGLVLILAGSNIFAQSNYTAVWEDDRFEFYGNIFVLSENSLNELYTAEEQEELSYYFVDRELNDPENLYYTESELEQLEDYRGKNLNYQEILEFSENFTLIAVQAHRPFDIENSHFKARVDVSEVVSISEGRIMEEITAHHMLLSDKQLEYSTSIRILPEGRGTILYVLPHLETEYLNVEIRSFLGNQFSRQTVTIQQ